MSKTLDQRLHASRQRQANALSVFQALADDLERASAESSTVANEAEDAAKYHQGVQEAAKAHADEALAQSRKIREFING